VTGLDALSSPGPDGMCCAACDAPLADDQRFCLACGLRCAPDELRLAALPLTAVPGMPPVAPVAALARRPVIRSAAITAVVVLTMGVAIGAALGPATVGQTAAAQAPLLIVSAPPPASDEPSDEDAPPDVAASAGTATPADEVVTLDDTSTPPATEAPPEDTAVVTPADPAPAAEEPPADDPAAEEEPPSVPPPDARKLPGVVLAADADRFTLAGRDGALLAVHAPGCGVAAGDDLHLRAWQLANGTWATDRVRRLPTPPSRLAAVGTVSWVDPAGGRYALGARGATLVVALPALPPSPPPDPATTTVPPASPPPALPALGEQVRVAFELPSPDGASVAQLVERARTTPPSAADPSVPPAPLELRGRVDAVDPQARTLALTLVAGDPTTTVTTTVSEPIDLAGVFAGQDVAVTATRAETGYALTGLSADGDASAADDPTAIWGDQAAVAAPTGDRRGTASTTCELLTPRFPR